MNIYVKFISGLISIMLGMYFILGFCVFNLSIWFAPLITTLTFFFSALGTVYLIDCLEEYWDKKEKVKQK